MKKPTMIQDAYISIELKAEQLKSFRTDLIESLAQCGIVAEEAAPSVHVSVAYGRGVVAVSELAQALERIASLDFRVRAAGYEILEGRATDFDYLVVSLESCGAFTAATRIAEDHMPVKNFAGGFKCHVSLLRFPKGALQSAAGQSLVRELNASHGAAFALGRCLSLAGECVCAFTPEREVCLQVPMAA